MKAPGKNKRSPTAHKKGGPAGTGPKHRAYGEFSSNPRE